jgi:hypothetical protein
VAGPTAISTDAGNIARLGNDGLVYVPDTVVDGTNEVTIQNSLPSEPTLELWVDPDATAGSITLSHSSLLDLAADDHPQYLTQTRGDARYINTAGDAMTGALTLIAPVGANDAARKADVDAVAARSVIAGNGLTGGGALTSSVTVNVGAGTGITVAADVVALDTAFADARYLTRDAGTGNSESVISSTAAASGVPSQGTGTVWVQY